MASLPRWRLLAYAGGDFAFNLYWQSVMLFLLFYYTEAVHLPLPLAAACYAVAMAWDGVVSLAIGIAIDRLVQPARYRRVIAWGTVPLGLCFALAYAMPPVHGPALFGWVLAGHLLFRTVYTAVNIPYLALSAQIGVTDADRRVLAGWRMVAGTLAAVLIAGGTLPLGRALTGAAPGSQSAPVFAAAALAFAVLGTVVMLGAVWAVPGRAAMPGAAQVPPSLRVIMTAWRDRGFVTLALAMFVMIIASTLIDKSVLYYCKYHLADPATGEQALGWMMATGLIAVPGWMALARPTKITGVWFVGVALGIAALVAFIAGLVAGALALKAFLVVVQIALIGMQFVVWALLPQVIAGTEARSGAAMGAGVYGAFAMLSRIGIGCGTLVLGSVLGDIRHAAPAAASASLRLSVAAIPLVLLLIAAIVMAASPLARRLR